MDPFCQSWVLSVYSLGWPYGGGPQKTGLVQEVSRVAAPEATVWPGRVSTAFDPSMTVAFAVIVPEPVPLTCRLAVSVRFLTELATNTSETNWAGRHERVTSPTIPTQFRAMY